MADKFLIDDDYNFRIFDYNGQDYLEYKNTRRNILYLNILGVIGCIAGTIAFGYSARYCDNINYNGLAFLSGIAFIVSLIGTIIYLSFNPIREAYEDMVNAKNKYNKALLDNHDAITEAIYKAKEKKALHEATIQAAKKEKVFSFMKEAEKKH